MAIETRSEVHKSYLHMLCWGSFKFKDMKDIFLKAFELAVEKNLSKILIDGMDVSGTPPTMLERYDLGEYVAQLCFKYKKPFRIVVAGKVPFVDPDRFGETVARNLGVNGRVFTNLEEAITWLNL
jgi:hypothetical protein